MSFDTQKNQIYLDYQSAKPVDPKVIQIMNEYHNPLWGNPSSLHLIGDVATNILDESRETVARYINANNKDEVIFTSGATESVNIALLGFALRNKKKGKHIVMSEVEHISQHNLAKYLIKQGFEVSKVPVDQFGRINLRKLQSRIRDDTILISVQMANNEIGTIQPIQEIGEITQEKSIVFHSDAVAAEGQLPIDVQKLNIDLLTLSSNDLYGPKGVGALYLRKGLHVTPLLIGGGQENGIRSGSENIPGIVGMKTAIELLKTEMNPEIIRLKKFQQDFIHKILDTIPDSHLNGHPTERLPNNTHFRFDGIEGESILLSFKDYGIAVSTGSACSSKTLEPSHTLIATGLLHEEAHGSLEFTTGRYTSQSDIDRAIEVTPSIVERLRKLSPLYKKN